MPSLPRTRGSLQFELREMAEQIIPEHEIVTIPTDDQNLRQQCYAVRIDVFHHEQKFPLETEIDEYVIYEPS